ncbi:hypothetical protein ACKKBG_A01110 [Auxenochlorella protothecoides x Auxenochlorella symbiontica]
MRRHVPLTRRIVAVLAGYSGTGVHSATPAWALAFSTSGPTRDAGTSGRLFNKILVANRGEIAVRVMRTAKKLGIPTVAVFSDADASAVHTRFADEAINIGPAPSTQSYLDMHKILAAMKATGADAVHPGYGFLSENAAFAQAVEDSGAAFVGPPHHAVHAMGDKVESKRFAHAAGVNTIPGWAGVVESAEHAIELAKDIGYPVMIKASAGGGGKGMRIAWDEKGLAEGFELASQEAASSFGDSRMLIEKFIEEPRHIEIQVMGDKHGNVVFFPERECSIQRRNQKVIEEAPSPFVPPELREAMGKQAVALCHAVGYHSAGTCEFLVDKHRNFYFLEMNTRLQVEHPVTEAITRQDLVELMLRVAAGQKLDVSQEEANRVHGWAMESRVYAEDPARGFLPSTGRLMRYAPPRGEGVRVDTGVQEGSEISMYYDPMICKLITHGADRPQALQRMRQALDSYVVRGVQHNIPLLRSVLDRPDFVAGTFSTAFLAQHYPSPADSAPAVLPLTRAQEQELLALAAVLHVLRSTARAGRADGLSEPVDLVLTMGEEQFPARLRPSPAGLVPSSSAAAAGPSFQVELAERVLQVTPEAGPSELAGVLARASIDGVQIAAQVLELGARDVALQVAGAQRRVRVATPAAAALAQLMPEPVREDFSRAVRSPMPGTLVSLAVAVGDAVRPGDDVAVVEAMKMRNVLRAEVEGVVAAVEAAPGDTVAADQVLLRFD